ncbi:DMT family transporter [Desulfoluna butyratoxydans]|uniref:Eama domain n=1 Tax=Desulfoluna butyratoxydans TaxID=231438 RepID=A0A4U8YIY5_9BACT|nr:DMT family transporter [Desulfoluna butyratoxydans]VFQ43307.1 eama domain [Desulfoluna butyratoxydans]
MTSHKNHLPLLIFAVLGVVWGSNFIYMKMAVDLITPGQVVLYRVLFGFVPVLAYAGMRRDLRLGHLRHAHHFLVMSVLATAFYYYCFAKGASLLLSGIAGAVSGAIPLFAFVMAVIFIPEEKATVRKLCGVLVALAGVVLISRPTGQEVLTTNLEGIGYMVAGSLGVGASFVYARKFIVPLHIPAAALTTYQLGFGLLILALVTNTSGIGRIWTAPHASIGLVVGLGLLGTGFAYILYYYIVDTMGAVAASSVTYLPPVVALFIGVLLVGEPITPADFAATGMIFVGVFLLKE